MKNIKYLLEELKQETTKYGEKIQTPLKQSEIDILKNNFKSNFKKNIDEYYLVILSITDGFDNNGVVLYASKTQKIEGYDDRFIDGLLEANALWHKDIDKVSYIFYAESEMYLFFQDIQTDVFSCVSRDNLENIIFQTKSSKSFFENIINLSLGNSIEN